MSEKEFSLEQSEELIANLKSGHPSEFEQLRSALNLLAHVPEISPVSTPPILPSTITQPTPVIPIRSSKSRRTVVTSIIVIGLFGTGSLAAAAVTGIGPSIFVNAGHSAAKFVRNVVGGVGHVVTGNNSDSNQNQASGSVSTADNKSGTPTLALLGPTPAQTSNSNEENNQNDSEQSPIVLPLVSNLIPPLTNSNSHENNSQTPNSSHETQGPSTEDSHQSAPRVEKSQPPSEDQNQSESHPVAQPTPDISATPSAEPTGEPNVVPTIEPSSLPSAESTNQTNTEN